MTNKPTIGKRLICFLLAILMIFSQMPTEIISAETKYSVTIASTIQNGTVLADKETAAVGDTVTLTVTPAEGYAVSWIKANDSLVELKDNAYTFTMPEKGVTVTAEFKKTYTVTIDSTIQHGKVEADKTTAINDDTVTLTVTPDSDYELETLSYQGEGDENATPITVTDSVYSFTMPEKNVTVTATFKATSKQKETEPNYLTFTAEEANAQLGYGRASGTMWYRTGDGTTWSDWCSCNDYGTITLAHTGDKVQFKGENVSTSNDKWYHFRIGYVDEGATYGGDLTTSGKISASGDVTSLTNGVGGDVQLSRDCYYAMFNGCHSLVTAPNLPSTNLAVGCYKNMFLECTSLSTPPTLPATTLASECYQNMFASSGLSTGPILPATTLASKCYCYMFDNCTNLTTAPALPATELTNSCYLMMFNNCTALAIAPALPATELADNCYEKMFNNCTALATAPALPAAELKGSCYDEMFRNCTSLMTAPLLPATTLADSCYAGMFTGCSALTTAPSLPATTLAGSCYANMFQNCTALTSAPLLPATTLAGGCYSYMFSGCKSLTKVPELSATALSAECYYSMFAGCIGLRFSLEDMGGGSWSLPSNADTSADYCVSCMFESVANIDVTPEPGKVYYYDEGCLTFTSDAAFSITPKGLWNGTLEYSTDGEKWNTVTSGTTVSSSTGTTAALYFRGMGNTVITGYVDSEYAWTLTPTVGHFISAEGNIMTLMNYQCPNGLMSEKDFLDSAYSTQYDSYEAYLSAMGVLSEDEFQYSDLRSIYNWNYSTYKNAMIKGPQLAEKAFAYMFAGQTSLIKLPKLSSKNLAYNCYNGMFFGCTGIRIGTTDMGLGSWSGIPADAGTVEVADTPMFLNTGGSFDNTPFFGTTYYYEPYAITNTTPENDQATNHGYIIVNSGAPAGDKVTVSVVPNTDYEIKTLELIYDNDECTRQTLTVSSNTASFTMPMCPVSVKATFKSSIVHVHSWTYGVSGAAFTATCSGAGECDNTATSLSITAPSSLSYDGNAKNCTLSATALGEKTGISADNIKYYMKGESTEMTGKPTEVGTYVAKLTIDGVGTAELEFTVKASPVSLTIGSNTTWYSTVQGACDAAGTNKATVTLYQNMTENVKVNSGENITIDLDGYVLKSAANQKPVILNSGTLTVKSSNTERKHYFTESSNKLWTWNNDATETDYFVTGGVITGGYSTAYDDANFGCGIRTTSTLTVEHINIVGNTNRYGGGIRVNSGTVKIYDSKIAHNYSMGGGAGIGFNGANSTYTMERCDVSDNYCDGNAGGIVVLGTLTMTDCTVKDNYATGDAGGIRLYNSGAKVTINGGSITGNTSKGKGGGVYFDNAGSLTLGGDVVISGNTGESKTENIYLPSGKKATVSNPGTGMNVGVTLANGTGKFTGSATKAYEAYFFSDNTAYADKYNDGGYLELVTGYKVTEAECTNGAVSVGNQKSAYSGETVTVTAAPADEYVLDTLTYTPSGGSATDITSAKQFEMPASAVTVSATFKSSIEHVHSWRYSLSKTNADNDTITAACTEDCPYEGTDKSLTIQAPASLVYDGKSHDAGFGTTTTFLGSTLLPTITYGYNSSEAKNYQTAEDTVKAGYYKASFTVGDKTASVEYTISKATPAAGDFNFTPPTDLLWNGTVKEATVTAKDGISGMGKVTVKYYSDEACTTEKDPIDAGTYYVGIMVAEGDNYAASSEMIKDAAWTFTIQAAAAKVTTSDSTTTYYATIDAAVTAWVNNSTLTLLADANANLTVASDACKTLDLNGYVLKSAADDKPVISINNDGTNYGNLTVTDNSTDTRTHYFKVNSEGLWVLTNETAGAKSFEELTNRPKTDDIIIVSGGCITGGNNESSGGGVENRGTFKFEKGNIVGNAAAGNGGGISSGYKADISGGNIMGNTASSTGGGIYSNGVLTISNGNILYNTAVGNGGGVYTDFDNLYVSGGKISGNTAVNGGGICNGYNGKLTISGTAVITGNTASGTGGGVYNDEPEGEGESRLPGGTMTMTGGSITGNKAATGGGVTFGESITLGGTAKISGNTLSNGTTVNNLYLPSGKTVTISTTTVLAEGAEIGVTTAVAPAAGSPVAITGTNGSDYSGYFKSDVTEYSIQNSDATNNIVQLVDHQHSWEYTLSENKATISAECKAPNHSGDNPETLTISAPVAETLTYNGQAKAASLSAASIGDYKSLTIQYQKKNDQTWEEATTTAPTNAGTYKASITVDTNKTAYVEYTITKATPAATDFNYTAPADLVWNDTAKTAKVQAKNSVTGMGNITVKYYSDADCTQEAEPKAAGTYYVSIMVAEGDNYAASSEMIKDSSWTFTIQAAVAKVTTSDSTTTYYATIDEAVNNWDDGCTLTLLADANTNLTVPSGETRTLDLNGYVLKGDGVPPTEESPNHSVITNNGTLTVTDSNTANQTHYFSYSKSEAWVLKDDAAADAKAAAIEVSAIRSETSDDTLIKVSGGCITGGTGTYIAESVSEYGGGGIYGTGSLTLNGGNIVGNQATFGGGVYADNNATVTMNGGTVSGNKAWKGGGVTGNTIAMNGGSIINNTAEDVGGGVMGNTIEISGGSITNNTAKQQGGGVYSFYGTITISGGSITNNTAQFSGGGVFSGISNGIPGTILITAGTITGNKAAVGGGVFGLQTTVGGSAQITGNTTFDGSIASNVGIPNLLEDYLLSIDADSLEQAATKMKIGVTLVDVNTGASTDGAFTKKNADDYSSYFTSDIASYKVYNSGSDTNQILILSTHEHEWHYGVGTTTVENDTLKAWCSETFGASVCGEFNTENNADKLTLVAPLHQTYGDGQNTSATFKDDKTTLAGLSALPTIMYEGTGSTEYSKSSTAPSDAGTYKASITIGSGDDAKTAYVTYTIAKAEVDVPTAKTGLSYTGEEQTGVDQPTDAKYTLSNNKMTDAGNYTATAQLTDKTNYAWKDKSTSDNQTIDWSITKATSNTITNLTCADVTFGTAPSPSADATFKGNDEPTFTYSTEENGEYKVWNTSNPVGTYWVKASVADTNNYNGTDGKISFKVKPKTTALSVDSITNQTYCGAAIEPTVIVKDAAGNELTKDTDYTVEYSDNLNAGTAKVKVTGINGYATLSAEKTFTIEKRKISFTGKSGSKVYNGTEQKVEGFDIGETGLVEGHTSNASASASGTVKGEYTGTITAKENIVIQDAAQNDVTANYDITAANVGKLTITAITTPITITAKSKTKIYDGQPLTESGYDYTENVLVEGDVLSAAVEGTITNAGTTDNIVTSYQVKRGETDVTNCYTFAESLKGTLSISKRSVSLYSESASKDYDGTALTAPNVYADASKNPVDSIFAGEVDDLKATGTITDVSDSPVDNPISYNFKAGFTADNYEISKTEGQLTITQNGGMTVAGTNYQGVYDGQAHGKAAIPSIAEGTTVSYSIDGGTTWTTKVPTITNVGKTEVKVKAENSNYKTATCTYTLEVTKRSATLTSASDSKTYDGTALTNSTVTQSNFVDGESAKCTMTGTQTDAGSSDNSFTYAAGQNTDLKNYDVRTNFGKLTVNVRPVTLVSLSATKVYDGKALTSAEVYGSAEKGAVDSVFAGEVKDLKATGTVTDVSDSPVTNAITYAGKTAFKASNYSVEKTEGTLTVTPITTPITITANSSTKVYDSTALKDSGFTYTDKVLVSGDELSAVVEGSITDAGTAANKVTSYKVTRGEKDVTANYTFAKSIDGVLTVTKAEASIKIKPQSFKTDGTLSYTGTSQDLVRPGTADGGEMQYCLGTAEAAGTSWSAAVPQGKDGGDYYVWYRVKCDDNHLEDVYCTKDEAVKVTIVQKHLVVFDTGDGTAVAAQKVENGKYVVRPESPTYDGFIFQGWYEDQDCTKVFDFSKKITAATTIYAKWKEKEVTRYTVTFDAQGGKFSDVQSTIQSVVDGSKATKPEDPKWEGYTFGGWYTTESCTIAYDFEKTTVTSDKTLYAKWTEEKVNLSVDKEIIIDDSIDKALQKTVEKELADDSKTKVEKLAEAVKEEGKKAIIEKAEEKAEVKVPESSIVDIDITVNVTAKAADTSEKMEVVYDLTPVAKVSEVTTRGESETKKTIAENVPVGNEDLTGETFTIKVPTLGMKPVEILHKSKDADGKEYVKDAYAVADTYDSTNQTVTVEVNSFSTLTLNGSRTYYEVKFDSSGHGTAPTKQVVAANTRATEPTALTAEGCTFGGWYKDKECTQAYNFADYVEKDITLYAKWTKDTTYHFVAFDGNGDDVTGSMTEMAVQCGTSANLTANAFKKNGYTFDGWKDTNGNSYADQASFTAPDTQGTTTLKAQWKQDEYQIVFDSKGGSAVAGQTKHCGDKIDKPKTDPARENYVFDGWYIDAACTKAWDFDEDILTAEMAKNKTFTLYAKWLKEVDICTIETIADQTFTGKAIEPEITVKDDTTALVKGQDYTVEYSDNLNAGTATVTITGNGDYTSSKTAEFKILPKSIEGAQVTLDTSVFIENGSTQTAKVKSVRLAGWDQTITYIVSDNTAKAAGSYTLKVTGTDNYTGVVAVPFSVVARSTEDEGPISGKTPWKPFGQDDGTVTFETIPTTSDTPKTTINMNKADLTAAVATAGDLKSVKDGSTLDIWLEVTKNDDNVRSEVKQAIENVIGDKKVGCYLDASLFKKITSDTGATLLDKTKITELNNGRSILIGVTVPEELIANNSDFGIARYHGTTAEVLESYYDTETKTVYFSTDKFSDYAIIMTPNAEASPNTGITSQSSALPAAGILIGLAALIGLGWILRKKVNG